ncbi:MAG TPA: hypothetical protein VGO57_06125 [Verrucomicrobiae bacterium]|jgi:hypothetical protein
MLDTATIDRFENALPVGFSALRELAMSMASEGLSQAAIYHAFDSFGHYLKDAGRDPFERVMVWGSIENIVGWRSRDSWWFDHTLSLEEINEYRKAMAYQTSPHCFYFDEDA